MNFFTDDILWHTTQESLTQEEEDAIISLTVIVIGVIAAIVVLFSMGVFIDCREQYVKKILNEKLKGKK